MNTYKQEYRDKCYNDIIKHIQKASKMDTINMYIMKNSDEFGLLGYDVDLIKYHVGDSFLFNFRHFDCVNNMTRDMFAGNKQKRNDHFIHEINKRMPKNEILEIISPNIGPFAHPFSRYENDNDCFLGFVRENKSNQNK